MLKHLHTCCYNYFTIIYLETRGKKARSSGRPRLTGWREARIASTQGVAPTHGVAPTYRVSAESPTQGVTPTTHRVSSAVSTAVSAATYTEIAAHRAKAV